MTVSLKSVSGDGCVEGELWSPEADYECRSSVFYVKSVPDCGMFLYITVYFAIFTVMQWYLILQEHVTPVGLCKLLIAS
jgi:hypothetical protein